MKEFPSESECEYYFEIGGETLVGSDAPDPPPEIDEARVRVGTLLKTESVSFLLGAGASCDCGGPLIGSIPLDIEWNLHTKATEEVGEQEIPSWLRLFYLSVWYSGDDESTPTEPEAIMERRMALKNKEGNSPHRLAANFEQVLITLYHWRWALPNGTSCLQIDSSPSVNATADDLDRCIEYATSALARACNLPTDDKKERLETHKRFLRKLLTRPLNLKRVKIFTLNYDTLIEQAADAEGIVLIDGFVGSLRRVFRPESYEEDLYFPAETTEGRVHRLDRVLHLYKLHGSITWKATKPTIDNPYGIEATRFDPEGKGLLLIYPTPAKYGETLGLPYSELFRRFATAIVRSQSVLFVIGYGFGDEHVNAIIRQALTVPSFTLVIVDPKPDSSFVETLRKQKDRRVWIASGETLGTFKGFTEDLLPDLRDEEILKRVIATQRALAKNESDEGCESDDERF